MEFKVGQIVKSIAGHDKGDLLMITEIEENSVFVSDGKQRPLEKPKRKNLRHVEVTSSIFDVNLIATNRKLRRTINELKKLSEVN
ncbi:MAG: KOW domain-containing RNA-binding protein [Clostridia bacterium]